MFSYLNPLPHLSKYRGPYKVGSTEFEIPVSEIKSSTEVPDARITTVKFRVFYPTNSSATSKQSIPWLPTPQKVWNQAIAEFLGMSEKRASWLSSLPSILNYATIPAIQNAPLLESSEPHSYPIVIFSHGLGGNYNIYSSILGSLASCGVICVTPEHRDGSAPTALIKSSREKVETKIAYQKLSHSPTVDVLNTRNSMLRVRLWELELTYSAIKQINSGKQFTNFADAVSETSKPPSFLNTIDFRPGRVTWAGHSFGSASMVQFVKSVYYHQDAPRTGPSSGDNQEWNMTPLYSPTPDSELVKQITPQSPVVLLDLWTMPLRGEPGRWLWEKPLPCYKRSPTATPTVISIISTEFYKWPELRNRVRAVLSPNADQSLAESAKNDGSDGQEQAKPTISNQIVSNLPITKQDQTQEQRHDAGEAEAELHEPVEPEVIPQPESPIEEIQRTLSSSRTPSPSRSPSTSTPRSEQSARSSHSSLPLATTTTSSSPAQLYLIPSTAHLSQSDFGPLFPNLTRYFMHALNPEETIEMNARAILALMRNCGLPVSGALHDADLDANGRDHMLDDDAVVPRWERIKL